MPSPAYRSGSSYQSSSGMVANVALPKPSGVVSGDLLLALAAFLYQVDTSTRTIIPPAGWTQLQHSNAVLGGSYNSAITLFYKVADGSEPATINFLLSNSDLSQGLGIMLAIQDAGIGVSGKLETAATSNTVHTPAIVGTGECLDIRMVISMYSPGTYSAPATYTIRQAAYNSYLGSPIGTATKLQASAGTYASVAFPLGASVSGMQVGFSILARGPQETVDVAEAISRVTIEHFDVHEGSGTIYSDAETAVLLATASSIDGMTYTDSATARLSFTPSGVDGLHHTDAGTALLTFTPITTHECVSRFVLSVEVVSLENRWNATTTLNKYNNVSAITKYVVAYVGVDPSVSDC